MDIYEEDGVAKEGPRENRNADDRDDDDFSMSSYDGDHSDSLVIKPPQAKILHRDKREKREKKDSHRHKSEKHKDRRRNKNRSTGHEERRREGRRHRKEGEKKEQKQRRKERSSKHDRHSGDGRKHEKERRRRLAQGEMYEESRDPYDERERGGQHMRGHMGAHPSSLVYRGKRYESRMYGNQNFSAHHLSPREKTEREKRMEKFMLAEKQKEITQKEADVRRQRKEEEKIEELRRRAEASMLRHTGRTRGANDYHEDHHRRKKKKLEPETVELISDEENDFSPNEMEVDLDEVEVERGDERGYDKADVEEEEEGIIKEVGEDDNKLEIASSKSSSSSESSDSDSSSSSSSEGEDNEVEETEAVHENEEKIEPKDEDVKDKISGTRSSVHSLSGDTTDEEKKESDDENKFVDENYNLDESPVPSSPELKEDLPPYFPAIMGCRSVDEFTCLNKIEEGTYGVVYRAKEKSSGEIVALKRLKMEKEKEGFPITSLREVNTLLKGQHENIVTVREIVVGSNMDKIYIVMDYVEHDLKSLMEMMRKKKQMFTMGEIKTLMIQLLRAIRHLHDNWILHRDIKTSNLLLSHRGVLKVGDFGLAREYGSPLKHYTPIVVTLWYRSPELLLGSKLYSCPIDVWSCGCVFGELLGMEPMFPGKSEIDQLNKIFKDLGTPSDKIWPGYSDMPVTKKTQFACFPYNHLKERYKNRLSNEGFKLMNSFLTYNPAKRITASDALEHDYFHMEDPAPIATSMFPTWPAKSENPHGARNKKGDSPKPPSGGKNFKDLGDGEDENIAGFFLGGAPSSGPGFTLKF